MKKEESKIEENKTEENKKKVPMDPKKKKKLIWAIVGGVVLLFIVMNIIGSIIAGAKGMPVQTVAAKKGDIQANVSTSGNVVTNESKTYYSRVDAIIGCVNVSSGDMVHTGDVMLSYDADSLELLKAQTELKQQANEGSYDSTVEKNNGLIHDLSEASTNLGVLEQQIEDIDNYCKELQAAINEKKAALAYEGELLQITLLDWRDKPDSDEYLEIQKQIQRNSYEQTYNQELRDLQDEYNKYNEMLANCKEYRAEMKSQKSSSKSGMLNEGGREELEANNQINQMNTQKTLDFIAEVEDGVCADFNGVVTEVNVVEGATPASGAALLKVDSTDSVKVEIAVTKYDLSKISEGQSVTVTIGDNTYEGQVKKIDRMATKNSSGAAVVGTEIEILNPDDKIVLGVEAKTVIHVADAQDVLMVPTISVNTDVDGTFVYVVENGVITRKNIVTGIVSDDMTQVTEGLSEGAQVVSEVTTVIEEGVKAMAVPAN